MAEQQIRFTDHDGRRIAWARTGDGPPLVFAGWWMSNLELNWRDPRFRAYVDALGRHRTVIRYDPPGTALSAGDSDTPADLESEAAALAAVVDASGASRVDLIAGSSGAPVGLDLVDLFARQISIIGSSDGTRAELAAVLELMARGVLAPVIDTVLPLEDAAEAHRRLEAREHDGRLLLKP